MFIFLIFSFFLKMNLLSFVKMTKSNISMVFHVFSKIIYFFCLRKTSVRVIYFI